LKQEESQFWDLHLGIPGKVTFGCSPHGEAYRVYYKEGSDASSQRLWVV
jgi:hypothetical protein